VGTPAVVVAVQRTRPWLPVPNVALFNSKQQGAARAGLHQPRIKDQQLYMDVLDEVNSRSAGHSCPAQQHCYSRNTGLACMSASLLGTSLVASIKSHAEAAQMSPAVCARGDGAVAEGCATV
jgi:hypothetical protein